MKGVAVCVSVCRSCRHCPAAYLVVVVYLVLGGRAGEMTTSDRCYHTVLFLSVVGFASLI